MFKAIYKRNKRKLEMASLRRCISHIPVLAKSNVSAEWFFDNHIISSIPCVIHGLAVDWTAITEGKWSMDGLKKHYGNGYFECGLNYVTQEPVIKKMSSFLAYIERENNRGDSDDHMPLYLFDPTFDFDCPEISHDYAIPPLFGEDAISSLPLSLRPHHKWLVIGGTNSGSFMHIDPLGSCAWNTVVEGTKEWILVSPSFTPQKRIMSFLLQQSSISLSSWFQRTIHMIKDESFGRNTDDVVYHFTQQPGETVFVPAGWYHAVLNHGCTVAITHNFVPIAKPDDVCRFFSLLSENEDNLSSS